MNIVYMSVHEILEYDELKLLSELGHQCFSLGAYTHPGGDDNRKRPPLTGLPYDPHFIELATRYGKELHPEMLEGKDAVIVMHEPSFIESNWSALKTFMDQGGRVIWRSIGQSVPHQERKLTPYRNEGMEIVRYSPAESTIAEYMGSDALIRFAKDPKDFKGWTGEQGGVVNFTQSLMQRGKFCGLETIQAMAEYFPVKVYGPGNEDLGGLSGGMVSYEKQLDILRGAGVYLYTGTYPASYTLSFIEAWMTGLPVVAVGNIRGNSRDFNQQRTYEVDSLITQGRDGYFTDDFEQMRQYITQLLEDKAFAKKMGQMARLRAIELFGTEAIKKEWSNFLR